MDTAKKMQPKKHGSVLQNRSPRRAESPEVLFLELKSEEQCKAFTALKNHPTSIKVMNKISP
jgi:DNA-dependent RNA polymerase auxiliary subunit epsilon